MSDNNTDKQFTKDFTKLTAMITQRLREADSVDEIQNELSMLEGMATNPNAPAPAKTICGLAYLMEDKEWYDFKKGFEWVKKGADDAHDNEPFSWFILGSLYLNGKPDLQKDMVSAKYWICKAADVGFKEAVFIKDLYWGDNPAGFKDYMLEQIEKDYERKENLKKIIPIILVLLVVGLIAYFLLR